MTTKKNHDPNVHRDALIARAELLRGAGIPIDLSIAPQDLLSDTRGRRALRLSIADESIDVADTAEALHCLTAAAAVVARLISVGEQEDDGEFAGDGGV